MMFIDGQVLMRPEKKGVDKAWEKQKTMSWDTKSMTMVSMSMVVCIYIYTMIIYIYTIIYIGVLNKVVNCSDWGNNHGQLASKSGIIVVG